MDEMGPTSSTVTLAGTAGFVRFEKGQSVYVAYVCETWSADSDECEGSVVQGAELAELVGDSTKVIWSSKTLEPSPRR